MSWPLGYSKQWLHTDVTGAIFASSCAVTDANGWIEIALPAIASAQGAPSALSIRIRLAADVDGEPFLYAEQIEIGGRRHQGIQALMASHGARWLPTLVEAIYVEIARRVRQAGLAGEHFDHHAQAREPVPSSSLRPVVRQHLSESGRPVVRCDAVGTVATRDPKA